MEMCCCYHRIVKATYFSQFDAGAIYLLPVVARVQKRILETRVFVKKYPLMQGWICSTPRGNHGLYILL